MRKKERETMEYFKQVTHGAIKECESALSKLKWIENYMIEELKK